MAARRDLVAGDAAVTGLSNDVLGWIGRQGQVESLSTVDLNYPQHFSGFTFEQVSRLGGRSCPVGVRLDVGVA